MILTPLTAFLFVLVIGIVCGLAFDRILGAGWLTRQIAGATRHQVTSALVGIAGAFIGLHIGIVLGLLFWPPLLYIAAVIGTFVTSWGWHRWI